MELFMPTRVFFEPGALDYPLGHELYELMAAKGIPRRITLPQPRAWDPRRYTPDRLP